jgi:hypothetical protein
MISKIGLTLFFFIIFKQAAFAQERSSSSIIWNSTRTFNVEQGSIQDENTSLACIGDTHIEWKNSDGSLRRRFDVVETIGSWYSVGDQGSVQYEISDDTSRGSIVITKNAAGLKALITIIASGTQTYELTLQL